MTRDQWRALKAGLEDYRKAVVAHAQALADDNSTDDELINTGHAQTTAELGLTNVIMAICGLLNEAPAGRRGW
jgi:hypothetical protein